ncbi:MAG TPA: asparaginase [Chloroflexota bacterium]|nr:asparaginase [Chloroflexota bacterium]
MANARRLPRVATILTGGTIDSVGTDRLDLAWYVEANQRLAPGELLSRVPELRQLADIQDVPFRRLPSHALLDSDWLELARTLQGLFDRDEADGAVVTHGTNTLEETAYFLHLVLKTDRPIVVVGSMRPASGLSADGDLNLVNAVRAAADPASVGRGVLVVLNDTIHSARDVTKTATFRLETFQARDLGPLGYADADGRVIYYHRPERQHTLSTDIDVRGLDRLPRVDVTVSSVGADATAIDAFVAAGARGLVSAGTGAGRPTPAEDVALDRAAANGVVVCQSTRTGSGRVVRSPQLTARGFVAADNLTPWKARVLLSLALTRTSEPDEIQRYFDTC